MDTNNHRGFTLLEVLIALVVLSVGLLGQLVLQTHNVRANHLSQLRTQASILAADIVERMSLNAVEARAGGYALSQGSAAVNYAVDCEDPEQSCTPADLAGFDRYRWHQRVLQLLPAGDAAVSVDTSVNPARVTVTLIWDNSKGQDTPVSQNFVLELPP